MGMLKKSLLKERRSMMVNLTEGHAIKYVWERITSGLFCAPYAIIKAVPCMVWKAIKKVDIMLASIGINIIRQRTKINPDSIMFLTFSGKFDCNAKGIVTELLDRDCKYQYVWGVQPPPKKGVARIGFPSDSPIKQVVRGSYKFYKEISSAHVIVDNGISTAHLRYKKKEGQILIETWHGSLGIKKFSPSTVKDPNWVKKMYREAAMTDYLISNSKMEDEIYREDYWKETPILRLGHARNDVLFHINKEREEKLHETIWNKYHLPDDAKICLYAPTFRDDKDLRPYQIDYQGLHDALTERFGGNWIIMTRFHFRLRGIYKNISLPEFVINASTYPDIQDLLAFTDCGITDYSSWICEYMNTRKPGFLYATDMEHYESSERDFFYPLTALPYPLATNNEQLIRNVLEFDEKKFVDQCEAFLEEKGCIDDGYASERIADKIEELMAMPIE